MFPVIPKCHPKDREMSHSIWSSYHEDKLNGDKLVDQTELFFRRTPKIKRAFEASTNERIVQFGAGVGTFISAFATKKQVVGYDYTSISLDSLTGSGILARNVDLDEVKSTSELGYQHLLTEDLTIPSDILIIRLFEYITPAARILFLFALMTEAKPGSSFYIDIANSSYADESDPLILTGHAGRIPPNFIASFFSPRTDFKFIHHDVLPKTREFRFDMDVELLVVQKL